MGGFLPWRTIEATIRHNLVGSWQLALPKSAANVARLLPARGVIILRDGRPFVSGPIEEIKGSWEAERDGDGPGQLTVSGADDLSIIADELAVPNPVVDIASQTSWGTDDRSGTLEAVIKGYVTANVGTTRAVWRNDTPGQQLLTIATSLGRGPAVSYKARFDSLMDLVRTLIGAHNMGVRVTQVGTTLVFDVYEPADKTSTVRFSRAMRNLRGVDWTRAAPETTHAVVAGAVEGVVRNVRERKDIAAAAEWGHVVRTLRDERQTSVASELDAAGDEELARGRRSSALGITIVETPRLRFGQHFDRGDRITVEPEDGVRYEDVVTAATLRGDAESGRENLTLTIGPEREPDDPVQYDRVRELNQRLAALERNFAP